MRNNTGLLLCWIDNAGSESSCSRSVLVAAASRPPPLTSAPPLDPPVAGGGSPVLSDSARQAGRSPPGRHGQDSSVNSSFNSSTLRSKSPNSRIRKQPEMPRRPYGETSTGGGSSSVRRSVWNFQEVVLMVLTVSISACNTFALLNCSRCQRLTSS